MIGTNLGLTLPSLSDSMATMVSKTATALSAIQVSIADKATPAGLNINAALSFAGNWATSVGGIVLAAGNHPTAAGSFYYSGGEFFMVDATGAIQLTSAGALNAASVAGIGGDYGGANPASAIYNNASGQFRFFSNGGTSTYADVACLGVVLKGSAGSVRLSCDAAIGSAREMKVKSLPASGTSFLVYASATSTVEDSAVNTDAKTIAGAVTFANAVTITGDLTLSAELKHPNWSMNLSLVSETGTSTTTGVAIATTHPYRVDLTGGWFWASQDILSRLRGGERLKTISIRTSFGGGRTMNVDLKKAVTDLGGTTTVSVVQNWATVADSGNLLQALTLSSPLTLSGMDRLWLEFSGTAAGSDYWQALSITFDRP
jgi:hypothetical protein